MLAERELCRSLSACCTQSLAYGQATEAFSTMNISHGLVLLARLPSCKPPQHNYTAYGVEAHDTPTNDIIDVAALKRCLRIWMMPQSRKYCT